MMNRRRGDEADRRRKGETRRRHRMKQFVSAKKQRALLVSPSSRGAFGTDVRSIPRVLEPEDTPPTRHRDVPPEARCRRTRDTIVDEFVRPSGYRFIGLAQDPSMTRRPVCLIDPRASPIHLPPRRGGRIVRRGGHVQCLGERGRGGRQREG
ncbi:hypothetical protein BD626DRAFT_171366 [Schizophyllum amplum]|uniref:Uncharacterized protein n=1 Tax=Schizophyllum amplum TaxID=97359 RepID=A0A550CR28_9AGAR|nr:hypothetical protein BD626DRAFT_171366 [Auriculariopsis ampla]